MFHFGFGIFASHIPPALMALAYVVYFGLNTFNKTNSSPNEIIPENRISVEEQETKNASCYTDLIDDNYNQNFATPISDKPIIHQQVYNLHYYHSEDEGDLSKFHISFQSRPPPLFA